MSNTPNKVKYNLKNVYYAPITAEPEKAGDFPTYGTPVAIPGAVELSLAQQGSIKKFYADGIVYWSGSTNNGYEGDLTLALVPDHFRVACLGEELDDTSKVYMEKAGAKAKRFALLFEFEGDATGTRHILYNCTASRPDVAGKTNEEEIDPQTESMTITAVTLANGYVKARTGADTTTDVLGNWYKSVFCPGVEGGNATGGEVHS